MSPRIRSHEVVISSFSVKPPVTGRCINFTVRAISEHPNDIMKGLTAVARIYHNPICSVCFLQSSNTKRELIGQSVSKSVFTVFLISFSLFLTCRTDRNKKSTQFHRDRVIFLVSHIIYTLQARFRNWILAVSDSRLPSTA